MAKNKKIEPLMKDAYSIGYEMGYFGDKLHNKKEVEKKIKELKAESIKLGIDEKIREVFKQGKENGIKAAIEKKGMQDKKEERKEIPLPIKSEMNDKYDINRKVIDVNRSNKPDEKLKIINNDKNRIKTYIDGMDTMLFGGIPKYSAMVFSGAPGTLKSSIVFNIMYNIALKEKKKSLYFSFEQSRESLINHFFSMGFDVKKINAMIKIIDIGILRRKYPDMGNDVWLKILKLYISRNRKNLELVAIDSLPALSIAGRWENPRLEMIKLFIYLKKQKITSLLISEIPGNNYSDNLLKKEYGKFGEEYLCDGLIVNYMHELNDVSVQRRIRGIKLRKSYIDRKPYVIFPNKGGMVIKRSFV